MSLLLLNRIVLTGTSKPPQNNWDNCCGSFSLDQREMGKCFTVMLNLTLFQFKYLTWFYSKLDHITNVAPFLHYKCSFHNFSLNGGYNHLKSPYIAVALEHLIFFTYTFSQTTDLVCKCNILQLTQA